LQEPSARTAPSPSIATTSASYLLLRSFPPSRRRIDPDQRPGLDRVAQMAQQPALADPLEGVLGDM
jgi:hypothetical protein